MATQEENERLLKQFMDFSRREEQDKETVEERRNREAEERVRGGRRQRDGGGSRRPSARQVITPQALIDEILAEYKKLLESGRGSPDEVNALIAQIRDANPDLNFGDAQKLLDPIFDAWEDSGSLGSQIVVQDEQNLETVDDESFFSESAVPSNPLEAFGAQFGLSPEDPSNAAILPQLREALASTSQAGRQGLFGGALDDLLPVGGPDILRSAFSGLGQRAGTNFLFANAIGKAPTIGVEGGALPEGGINIGGSFSQFLRQPGAFGGFEGNVTDFLELADDPNSLAFRRGEGGLPDPAAFNLRQQLVNNPGSAFDFIGSQFQGPTFSPFAGAASRARQRIFGQFQRDNPNLTGLDFLRQFGQGDFSGLF